MLHTPEPMARPLRSAIPSYFHAIVSRRTPIASLFHTFGFRPDLTDDLSYPVQFPIGWGLGTHVSSDLILHTGPPSRIHDAHASLKTLAMEVSEHAQDQGTVCVLHRIYSNCPSATVRTLRSKWSSPCLNRRPCTQAKRKFTPPDLRPQLALHSIYASFHKLYNVNECLALEGCALRAAVDCICKDVAQHPAPFR